MYNDVDFILKNRRVTINNEESVIFQLNFFRVSKMSIKKSRTFILEVIKRLVPRGTR